MLRVLLFNCVKEPVPLTTPSFISCSSADSARAALNDLSRDMVKLVLDDLPVLCRRGDRSLRQKRFVFYYFSYHRSALPLS